MLPGSRGGMRYVYTLDPSTEPRRLLNWNKFLSTPPCTLTLLFLDGRVRQAKKPIERMEREKVEGGIEKQ